MEPSFQKQRYCTDRRQFADGCILHVAEARMAEMNCMGIGNKTCVDIKPSEDQINHRFVNLRSLGKTGQPVPTSQTAYGCSNKTTTVSMPTETAGSRGTLTAFKGFRRLSSLIQASQPRKNYFASSFRKKHNQVTDGWTDRVWFDIKLV